jgi:membrane protease YdiL (CAAX protease family)
MLIVCKSNLSVIFVLISRTILYFCQFYFMYMLKGSLSHITPAAKLALFLLLVIVFLLFSSLTGFVALMPFFGTGVLNDLVSPDYSNPAVINAMKALQIINMIGGLLLPALVYVWLIKGDAASDMKLSRFPGSLSLFLSALLIVVAQPFISFINDINGQMHLPAFMVGVESWMLNMEHQAKNLTDAFLATTSMPGLLLNVFMIAALPAITEEIVFRGLLAQLFRDWTHSKHWAIVISSLVFAGIHMQFYGFLPRFLLGISLGYLFFWTGSLWVPIVAHFANNLLSVIVEFLYRKGSISLNAEQLGFSDNVIIVISSILLTSAILFYFSKFKNRQQLKIPGIE